MAFKCSNSSWLDSFRCSPLGGAEGEQASLFFELRNTVSLKDVPDCWVWDLETSVEFSVYPAHNLIDLVILDTVSNAIRWVNLVPIKVNVFCWKMFMDQLPTRQIFSLKGLDIPSICCPICDAIMESNNHILFKCLVAKTVLAKILFWWDLQSYSFDSVAD